MKNFSLLTLVLLTLFSCSNNIEEEFPTVIEVEDPIVPIIDFDIEVKEVVATLFGEVFDEMGSPISDAEVTLNGNNTNTDESGRFIFKDLTMNQLGTYVEVNKNGYFRGSNRFFAESGSVNYVKITLMDRANIGNFSARNGAVISSPEGIIIDFPANSIIDGNGNLYQGNVEVAARWIDPTANNLQEIMPGSLHGIMPGGVSGNGNEPQEVALASFSMMVVELEGNNGEPLNLGNGEKATLSFPIPDDLLNNAPTEIPLWFFDETIGIWVIEGSATLEGDKYVGDVSHFSFWNCDVPFDLTIVCGTIVNSGGTPIANATIEIKILSSGASRSGRTNSNGEFLGKVVANELLELNIYINECGDQVLTENIGPILINSDPNICEDLGIFTYNNPLKEIEISANIVDCTYKPITNGWLEINLDGKKNSFYIDDGSSFSTTLLNCNDQTELSVLAGNFDDQMLSNEINYDITNSLDLGMIRSCDQVLEEWLTTTIDGTVIVFPEVAFSFDPNDESIFIRGQIPGTSAVVRFQIPNAIEGQNSYSNDNTIFGTMRSLTASGSEILHICHPDLPVNIGGPCNFSQFEILTFGNVGELVTGEISGSVLFFEEGEVGVDKDVEISFSIFRD